MLSAVIFDLDGTVISDEEIYAEAYISVLKDLGITVTKEYPHIGGIGVKENWPIFIKDYNIKTDKSVEQLTSETQEYYAKNISRVQIKSGFEEFIAQLRKENLLTALATSNDWWVVERVLHELNLEQFFDVITTGEEVLYKKPDPDLFLVTADKVNTEPEFCLVVEDAKSGVEAARRAGMKVVALARDSEHAGELKEADLVIKGFDELNVEKLVKLYY
jgi:HAD superfamily hydrolase (TIGR01509 family)